MQSSTLAATINEGTASAPGRTDEEARPHNDTGEIAVITFALSEKVCPKCGSQLSFDSTPGLCAICAKPDFRAMVVNEFLKGNYARSGHFYSTGEDLYSYDTRLARLEAGKVEVEQAFVLWKDTGHANRPTTRKHLEALKTALERETNG